MKMTILTLTTLTTSTQRGHSQYAELPAVVHVAATAACSLRVCSVKVFLKKMTLGIKLFLLRIVLQEMTYKY